MIFEHPEGGSGDRNRIFWSSDLRDATRGGVPLYEVFANANFCKKSARAKPRASRSSPGHEDLYTPIERSGKIRLPNEKAPLPRLPKPASGTMITPAKYSKAARHA
jgi:hypothetical protein